MQSPPASADAARVIILSPVLARPRGIAQVNVAVHQFTQAQVVAQGDRQQQPRIGHQAVIIKGNVDAVGLRR